MYGYNKEIDINQTMIFGIGWKSSAQIATLGSFFVVMAILAILLDPADLGMFGMAEGAISLLIILMESSIDNAIIQQKEISDEIVSTLFWLVLCLGIFLCLLGIGISDLVGSYFQEPQVATIVSALSFVFLFRSVSIVKRGLLERQMNFKTVAIIDIVANTLGSVLALIVALIYRNYWSLVTLSLARTGLTAIGLWFFSPWHPRFVFNYQASKPSIQFSSNLILYNFLYFFTRKSDVFLIGRFLGPEQLGYYLIAHQFVIRPTERLMTAVGSTLYPVMSSLQNDLSKIRETYTRTIHLVFLLLSPFLVTAAIIAPTALPILGEKWEPATDIFIVWCFGAVIFILISQINLFFLSLGKPELYWKYQAIALIATVISIFIGIQYGGALGAAIAINITQLILSILLISMGFSQVELKVTDFFRRFNYIFLAIIIMVIAGSLT